MPAHENSSFTFSSLPRLTRTTNKKKQLWRVGGFLAALLATSTAVGQTDRGDMIGNIPFAFKVANQTLPAGHYTFTRIGATTLRILNSRNQGAMVATHAVEGKAPEGWGKIVFHRYGDSYFLSEVWVAGNGIGRELFHSRAEKEKRRKRNRDGDNRTVDGPIANWKQGIWGRFPTFSLLDLEDTIRQRKSKTLFVLGKLENSSIATVDEAGRELSRVSIEHLASLGDQNHTRVFVLGSSTRVQESANPKPSKRPLTRSPFVAL
jgi:hypothetical protein